MIRLIAAAFLVTMLTGAGSAPVMPLSPLARAPAADVMEVAGGCGPGWHRGPYGGCLRNFAHPAAHACPRGFHIGPYGGRRGNGPQSVFEGRPAPGLIPGGGTARAKETRPNKRVERSGLLSTKPEPAAC